MAKNLGPTFADETIAAGLGGLQFAWGPTDEDIIGRENLTDEENATLDEVIAAHDPAQLPAPEFTTEEEVLYAHENRIRTLEGRPPLSRNEAIEHIRPKKPPRS
jgi:hypothetical protein